MIRVWAHVVLDLPDDRAARFWEQTLGWPLGPAWPDSPELASFEPPHGDAYVHRQVGPPRAHLDLETPDPVATEQRLIALGARIALRKGDARREIALEDFFIDYGKQDRAPGEFIETIVIPRKGAALVAAYKVSKRANADISAVAAGFRVLVEDGIITDARVAFGGMAGTPRRAPAAEAALNGRPFAAETFEAAARAVAGDFTPLSDWRASADYRRAVAGNFFRRFWLEQSGAAAASGMPVRTGPVNRRYGRKPSTGSDQATTSQTCSCTSRV